MVDYREYISAFADFPKEGVVFRDISPLLADGKAFGAAVRELAERVRGYRTDIVVGAEARGFVIGAPLARELGLGFVMVRKPGKLPGELLSRSYSLEYGTDTLCIERGIIPQGARVLVCDDLLATGGTARAVCELIRDAGAEPVCFAALIELRDLEGEKLISPVPVVSLVEY